MENSRESDERGRPRKRWREVVAKHMQEKHVNNWKTKARDRTVWERVTKLWA